MSLRIGIDMDGTLIDQLAVWMRFYNDIRERHGHRDEYTYTPTWEYPAELCRRCFHVCVHSPKLLRQSELMPGAAEALQALVEDGAALHLVTHRPAELAYEVQRLLVRRQVAQFFSSVTVTQEPKSAVCRRLDLDFMLDDAPSVHLDVRQTATAPIYYDQPYNRAFKGLRVQSWPEFVAQMTEPLEVA